MIRERPSLVFTLVHGTFARGAAWTEDRSPLREALSRGSPDPPTFLKFEWSGRNTNRARIAGGRALADHIRKTSADYPGARHVVVAHSHGGNVALYALRDIPKPHPELITLATPFIHGSPRAIDEFLWFVERILVYVIGVAILLLTVLIIELLVQGTIGAWLIGPCRVLTAACDGLQPLKGSEGQRTWKDFVFVGVYVAWFVVGIFHLPTVIDVISSEFLVAFEILFNRACDIRNRLTPTLPSDGSLLAIYVDADEPYGGLRLVDFVGGIPIRIVTRIIAGLGVFFAALPVLGKLSKGVYALLRGLGPDVQNFILVALIVLFLLFPFFCLILSLLGLLVVIRRIGYWDERLAEALLVELSVSSSPNVNWGPNARDKGDVASRAGACKYHFEQSLLRKFRGRLRHSHVYLEPRILNDLTAYVADGVLPAGFEPFSLSKLDIILDPDRLSRKDSSGIY
jgi:hypothetical protein